MYFGCMETLEIITANVSGKARSVKKRGREYLVAPVTLIVHGVLDGSEGPGYYPIDVLQSNPSVWNGYPLVKNHPTREGKPVSARDPDVLDEFGLGYLYNTSFFSEKLVSEAWFDVEDTKRVDIRIYNSLIKSELIEVSSGIYVGKVPAPENAVFNTASGKSKPYKFTVNVYRPDHLAVLPDDRGACSIDDGCGVFNSETVTKDEKSILRRIGEALGIVTNQTDVTDNKLSHDQLRSWLSVALKSRFSQSDPYCYIEEVYDNYIIYSQGSGLYKLGYTKTDTGVTLSSDEPTKVVRDVNYVATSNSSDTSTDTNTDSNPTNNTGDDTMALTAEQKKGHIDYITANCDCWKFKDADKTLNVMPDDNLVKLRSTVETENKNKLHMNTMQKGITDKEGNTYTFNGETGKWEVKIKEPEYTIANMQDVNGNAVQVRVPISTPVAGTQQTQQQTNNTQNQQLTDAEYLKTLPSGLQSILRNAMTVESNERVRLVELLTANVADTPEKRKAHPSYARLMNKSYDELVDLAALIPTNNSSPEYGQLPIQGQQFNTSYAGAGAGLNPVINNADDLESLESEEVDWGSDSPVRNYDPHFARRAVAAKNPTQKATA